MGELLEKYKERKAKEAEEKKRKREVRIYDTEKKEYYYPEDRRKQEKQMKKEALKKKLKKEAKISALDTDLTKRKYEEMQAETDPKKKEKLRKRFELWKETFGKK